MKVSSMSKIGRINLFAILLADRLAESKVTKKGLYSVDFSAKVAQWCINQNLKFKYEFKTKKKKKKY